MPEKEAGIYVREGERENRHGPGGWLRQMIKSEGHYSAKNFVLEDYRKALQPRSR